jgi:hypothetical protein
MVQEYIISHRYNTIFNIVAKAGTKSVRYLILNENNLYEKPEDIWFKIQNSVIHQPYFNKLITDNTHTLITIVRNPYNRLVSSYMDKFAGLYNDGSYYKLPICKEAINFHKRNFNDKRRITFREFVDFMITQDPNKIDGHFRPQTLLFDTKIKNNTILKIENSFNLRSKIKSCGFQKDFVNFDKDILGNNYKKIDVGEFVYDKDITYFRSLDKIIPKYNLFYNDEIKNKVYKYYENDFKILKYEY